MQQEGEEPLLCRALSSTIGARIAPPAYIGHATPKGKVRFMGHYPIKPHDPLLLSRPANSIPFLGCPGILEAP